MTEAEQAVADLDATLAADGEDIKLQRITGTTNQATFSVNCRAFIRGYTPNELVGGIIQGDSRVIISPTEIIRKQWPGPQVVTSPAPTSDKRVPRKNDKAIIAGKVRNVEAASPIYMGGELVRIEIQVRG